MSQDPADAQALVATVDAPSVGTAPPTTRAAPGTRDLRATAADRSYLSKTVWRALIALATLVVLAIGAGFAAWPSETEGSLGQPAGPPYLTVFLIDGWSKEVFERQLNQGDLPNISRMIREGVLVDHGLSAFPSMTAYGYYGFITGQDAVYGGTLGLRWYDRSRDRGGFRSYVGKTNSLFNEDMTTDRDTIFEEFGQAHSLTINTYANRGAHLSHKTGWRFTMAKYKGYWWVADLLSSLPLVRDEIAPDWIAVEQEVLNLAVEDLKNRPKVQWVTFVSPDTYCHVSGLGPRYPDLLTHIDSLIGEYRRASEAAGLEADRIYAIVSDHGVESTDRNIDLVRTLATVDIAAHRGEATVLMSDAVDDAESAFASASALVVINGNLMNYLYLKDPAAVGGNAWRIRPTYSALRAYPTNRGPVDLVSLLVSTDGIELVILKGADGTEIHRSGGVGLIRTSSVGYAYRFEGTDPLRHPESAHALLDGRPHTAAEWLAGTVEAPYPYAIVRLARLLAHEDAGDLVVTADIGVDLGEDFELFVGNYKGGHGGLRREQMVVPYILAGRGVPPGRRVTVATAEDIGATLRHLMGLRPALDAFGRRLDVVP